MSVHTSERKEHFKKHAGDCLCGLEMRSNDMGEDKETVLRYGEDWKEIFDTLTDVVTVHDRDFNIIGANTAAEKLLGLSLPGASNAKCYEYYHGSVCPPKWCPGRRCLADGKPATFAVYESQLKIYMEIRVIPRYDRDNRLTGLIHIARDVTRRKKAEEELEIHRHHLEWLVRQRTAEISFANEQLRREIAERRRVEVETERLLRELKDFMQTSGR